MCDGCKRPIGDSITERAMLLSHHGHRDPIFTATPWNIPHFDMYMALDSGTQALGWRLDRPRAPVRAEREAPAAMARSPCHKSGPDLQPALIETLMLVQALLLFRRLAAPPSPHGLVPAFLGPLPVTFAGRPARTRMGKRCARVCPPVRSPLQSRALVRVASGLLVLVLFESLKPVFGKCAAESQRDIRMCHASLCAPHISSMR